MENDVTTSRGRIVTVRRAGLPREARSGRLELSLLVINLRPPCITSRLPCQVSLQAFSAWRDT